MTVVRRSWTRDINISRFTNTLWKEFNKSSSEKPLYIIFGRKGGQLWPSVPYYTRPVSFCKGPSFTMFFLSTSPFTEVFWTDVPRRRKANRIGRPFSVKDLHQGLKILQLSRWRFVANGRRPDPTRLLLWANFIKFWKIHFVYVRGSSRQGRQTDVFGRILYADGLRLKLRIPLHEYSL